MHTNDEHICKLLRQHDIRGLELMFQAYYRPLVLWANSFVKDISAAEDIVQDFFVSFWEKRHYEKVISKTIRNYIFASIKNNALKYIAQRDQETNTVSLRNFVADFPDSDDLTEEMLQALEDEIEKLPPRTREILKSVYIDGMSYKDTAAKLGISYATVNTLIVSALKQLRKFFLKPPAFFS